MRKFKLDGERDREILRKVMTEKRKWHRETNKHTES
jgi:hypothetical protein